MRQSSNVPPTTPEKAAAARAKELNDQYLREMQCGGALGGAALGAIGGACVLGGVANPITWAPTVFIATVAALVGGAVGTAAGGIFNIFDPITAEEVLEDPEITHLSRAQGRRDRLLAMCKNDKARAECLEELSVHDRLVMCKTDKERTELLKQLSVNAPQSTTSPSPPTASTALGSGGLFGMCYRATVSPAPDAEFLVDGNPGNEHPVQRRKRRSFSENVRGGNTAQEGPALLRL